MTVNNNFPIATYFSQYSKLYKCDVLWRFHTSYRHQMKAKKGFEVWKRIHILCLQTKVKVVLSAPFITTIVSFDQNGKALEIKLGFKDLVIWNLNVYLFQKLLKLYLAIQIFIEECLLRLAQYVNKRLKKYSTKMLRHKTI